MPIFIMRATLPSGRLSWSFILSNPIVKRLTWIFFNGTIVIQGFEEHFVTVVSTHQRWLIDDFLAIHFG